MVEKAKRGDRFIKPDSRKIYKVMKVVINGDWVILKGEDGENQILTSQESLETWIKVKEANGDQ
jgi:hypothetical protein